MCSTSKLPTCKEIHESTLPSTIGPYDGDSGPHVDANVQAGQAKVIPVGVLEADIVEGNEVARRGCSGGGGKFEVDIVVMPFPGRV